MAQQVEGLDKFLRLGKTGYTYDLCNISESENVLTRRVALISDHIVDILERIERIKERPVKTFVIGKTFARRRERKRFDPKIFRTWRCAGGVDGRWRNAYKPRGFDGLVVVYAVTHNMIRCKPGRWLNDRKIFNKQHYVLAIEQQLIQHFTFTEQDPRLGNDSFHPGALESGSAEAFVIYVAFKLADVEE